MKKTLSLLRLLTVLLAVIWVTPAFAQISKGGTPPSFMSPVPPTALSTVDVPVNFDVLAVRLEDVKRDAQNLPPRVARLIPVHLTTENSGEWTTLPDGQRIWTLTLTAKGAIAIMLTYDKFEIPEGGKLFIYNEDRSHVLGAYTEENNPKRVEYATEFVAGDKITLEYVAPAGGNLDSPFTIAGVVYGYRYLQVVKKQAADGPQRYGQPSVSCMININCPEGDNWQFEKDGVARIIMLMGDGYYGMCSGTMLNNTLRNLDPLFLSAWHCFMEVTPAELNTTIFYFHFERAGCEGGFMSDTGFPTTIGAEMLVNISMGGGSDGALLRLNEGNPQWFIDRGIYFNGWDRRNIAPASGVGIHHPSGDVKKISTYSAPPASGGVYTIEGLTTAPNSAWNPVWVRTQTGHSIIEGGSSGSPLFNQEGRVVGTLTGASRDLTCSTPEELCIYGKLWWHYDQSSDPSWWMKPYLDPPGDGDEYVEGTYEPGDLKAFFRADRTEIFAIESVKFRDLSARASSWEWEFPGGSPSTYEGRTPPPIRYETPGSYNVTLTINKGHSTLEKDTTLYDHIIVSLKDRQTGTIGDADGYNSRLPLGIAIPTTYCNGTSFLGICLGTTDTYRKLYTAALYHQSELGWINPVNSDITAIAWETNVADAGARTVRIYLENVPATMTDLSGLSNTWATARGTATQVVNVTGWSNITGYQEFTLSTPFTYDPTGSLLVFVETEYTVAGSTDHNPQTPWTSVPNSTKSWYVAGNVATVTTQNATLRNDRPDIRLLNYTGVSWPVADFTMNASPVTPATIFEGDRVVFRDISDGPAVLYDWNIEGKSTYTTGTQSSISAGYEDEGSYTATLAIENTLGTATVTKEVIVSARTPIPQFGSLSDGLIRYSNRGPFLSQYRGGEVLFEDLSDYYPREWEWDFPSAETFSSSTESTSLVAYAPTTGGATATYDVTMKAINSAGTSTESKPGYVLLGGTDEVRNALEGENPATSYTMGVGLGCEYTVQYLENIDLSELIGMPLTANATVTIPDPSVPVTSVGTNAIAGTMVLSILPIPMESTVLAVELFSALSERFTAGGPGEVSEVRVYTQNVTPGSGSMTMAIYSDRGGVPGEPISEIKYIDGSAIAANGYNTFTFDCPVGVSERFHVVCSYEGDDVNYIIPSVPSRTNGFNTVCGYTGPMLFGSSFWASFNQIGLGSMFCQPITTAAPYLSLDIITEFTYTDATFLSPNTYNFKDVDATTYPLEFETTGSCWRATTADNWIVLSATAGQVDASGAGSLTFGVLDNIIPDVRRGKITVTVAGTSFEVFVTQGGSFPENFTATYDDEEENVLLTWGHRPYTPGDEIFEDVESYLHTDFAINSPGYYGWTYRNNPDPTYNSGDYSFTNENEPMAYIVFNPSQITIPSSMSGSYTPHSGGRYFACFNTASTITATNSWIISPEINFPSGSTFSFWARTAISQWGFERMKVGYSTTGTAEADFTYVSGSPYIEPPTAWTQYVYSIPAAAKYVAIQCVSLDAFIFFVDNIYVGTGPAPAPSFSPAESDAVINSMNLTKTVRGAAPSPAVNAQPGLFILQKPERQNHFQERLDSRSPFKLAPINTNPARVNSPATAPARTVGEYELRWDDGACYTGVGLQDASHVRVAARFEPIDMVEYKAITIKAVDIVLFQATNNIVLNIFQNNDLVHVQPIDNPAFSSYTFNRITLSTPLAIDMNKTLTVSYRYDQPAGVFGAGCDRGRAVDGKGNLIAIGDDDFMTLLAASGGALDYNWNIAVIVDAEPLDPPTYRIYRTPTADEVIVEYLLEEQHRDDVDMLEGTEYCYKITATYLDDDFFESVKSPAECVFNKARIRVIADDKQMREDTDPMPVWTASIAGTPITGHSIADIVDLAALTFTNTADRYSPPGTYSIDVESINLNPASYVVKDVSGVLTITTWENEVSQQPVSAIVCENSNYTFSVAADGLELTYQWERFVNNNWQMIAGATAESYTISNVTAAHAGRYRVLLTGRSDASYSEEAELKVAISPDILIFEYNDLPSINCNPATNGGYTFVAFQWYQGTVAIPGATKPYITADFGTAYDCEMTLADGRHLRLCNFTLTRSGIGLLFAYPNPASSGENVTVSLANALQGSSVNIFDLNGRIVKGNIPMQGDMAVVNTSGMAPGMYIIQVASPNGVKRTANIVVK